MNELQQDGGHLIYQHLHQRHDSQDTHDGFNSYSKSSCSIVPSPAYPPRDCASSSWDEMMVATADASANATAGEGQTDFHPRSYVIAWLHHTFEAAGTASMTKEELFTDYLRLCESDDKAPLMASMFGKLVHRAFPGLRSSRLGARGQSKHCYKCFRRRLGPSTGSSFSSMTVVTSSRPSVSSTSTTASSRRSSGCRPRSATCPLLGSRVKHESSEASLSSTILETVASRSGKGPRPKARTLSPSISTSISNSNSTSTRSAWPEPQSITTTTTTTSSALASPLPHALRTVSPQPLVDVNWSILYQAHNATGLLQQQHPVKQEGMESPQFVYDSPAPSPHLHTSPVSIIRPRSGAIGSSNGYRRPLVAHSRSQLHLMLQHEHDEDMDRMTPPAYISPLEVDYFSLTDAMDPHEFNMGGFCPSSPPQLSSIYSSPPPPPSSSSPALTSTTSTSTTAPSSSSSSSMATPRSSVGDLEQFRTFLTRLAGGESSGFDADLGGVGGGDSTPDLRHYHRHTAVFGATAAIGQSGLWRPTQVFAAMDYGQTAGMR